MAIDERFLDELMNRLDMVDVVGRYCKLEKRGNRWWGCCPFHNEKTPSFTVDPEKKMFYCFGCKEGGGIISFVEKTEKLEFPDAVSLLARMVGMDVPTDEREKSIYKRRTRLLALNKEAARFFHSNLEKEISAPARDYMARRQISRKMVIRFGLGYAPDQWDGLIKAMVAKGFDKGELLDAGLAVKSEKGHIYDRFRNRLIFPIIDVSGNVLGFGGRVLDDSLPKYLNSPESYVYHKANHLFAMNLAKNSTAPQFILAEGYMDVLMLHQAGFDNAVASLGTALTPEQADLIKKRKGEVVVAYDSDEAGQKATERAIELLRARDIKIKILKMKGAKDPDEYIKKYGSDAFRLLLSGSENSSDYRLEKIRAKYDITDDEQKLAFLNEAITLVSTFKNSIEVEIYIGKLAEITGIRRETIEGEVKKSLKRQRRQNERREMRENTNPEKNAQPSFTRIRYQNVTLARAAEGILSLLAHNPELKGLVEERIKPEDLGEEALIHLYGEICAAIDNGIYPNPDTMTDKLTADERKLLAMILANTPDGSPKLLVLDYLGVVAMESAKSKAKVDAKGLEELIAMKRNDTRYGNGRTGSNE